MPTKTPKIPQDAIQQRLQVALTGSVDASELVMSYYQSQQLQVDWKSDRSPVTAADRDAEEFLRRHLRAAFPDDAVMGEEFGETEGSSGYRWILDPVDGTKSFVHGVPLFGMLVGLEYQGAAVAGICRMPALNEVVYACKGGGAWWQQGTQAPVPARVSTTQSLAESLFCFTAVEGFLQIERMDVLQSLSEACYLARGWGDCYGHLLVATGRAEVMVDPLLAEWDGVALIPILEEAGGEFISWQGVRTARGGNAISTTPALKAAVIERLIE